jgi:hypothetical protein
LLRAKRLCFKQGSPPFWGGEPLATGLIITSQVICW